MNYLGKERKTFYSQKILCVRKNENSNVSATNIDIPMDPLIERTIMCQKKASHKGAGMSLPGLVGSRPATPSLN